MSCSQTLSGISRDCSANVGGIKRVLLANQSDVTTISITTNVVSTITMDTGKKFKEYTFRPNTGNLTMDNQYNDNNEFVGVQSVVTMLFNRMQTSIRVEIMAMAQADLYAIVEDMNGKYWLLGYDNPVYMSSNNGTTGTQRTERNGFTVALTDDSRELPYEVDSSIIAGLL